MPASGTLSIALDVYAKHHHEWAQNHYGEYVVIRDRDVIPTFFSDYGDAFKAGIQHFGTERNFLVKQVSDSEPVYFVS